MMRPQGILCLCDFLLNTDSRNLDRYARYESVLGPYGVFQLEDGGIVRHHAREWIDHLAAPFEALSIQEQTVRTMHGHTSGAILFIGKKP